MSLSYDGRPSASQEQGKWVDRYGWTDATLDNTRHSGLHRHRDHVLVDGDEAAGGDVVAIRRNLYILLAISNILAKLS